MVEVINRNRQSQRKMWGIWNRNKSAILIFESFYDDDDYKINSFYCIQMESKYIIENEY